MRVYVATTNAGKLAEMERLFADAPFELATYDAYDSPLAGSTKIGS